MGLEAFMEAYHIARTHPQLAPFVSDVQAQNDSYALHVRVTNPFAVSAILAGTEFTQQEIMDSLSEYAGLPAAEVPEGRTARDVMAHRVRELWNLGGIDLSRYSDSEILDAIEYVVFPNSLIFRNAAGHQNFRFRPNGNDPNSCLFDVYFLVPAGAERPRDSAVLKVPPGVRFQDHEPCNQLMGGFPRIENVPDARLIEPTDAVVTVTRACICGSDLWPYKTMEHTDSGRVMGHEAIGIAEAVGADVRTIKAGDLVVMPFAYSDGNCIFRVPTRLV